MCHPLGAIAVRPLGEVRLADRLQDEFERPLDHPVPNRRDSQDADPAPVFRNLDAPVPQWPVGACDQLVPELPQKPRDPVGLDRFERDAVDARRPVVPLARSYAARSVSSFATWTYRPQNRLVFSAFALT